MGYHSNKGIRGAPDVDGSIAPTNLDGLVYNATTKLWEPSGVASSTQANLHLYADGTSGDDANDGLSAATPKKTLVAVLVPDVIPTGIWVFVHLSGVFAETAAFNMPAAGGGGNLLVDGGTDRTAVDANVYTATSTATTHLTDVGAPFTADQYVNLEVEILTGAAAGEHRAVQSNSTTAITPMKNFSVDPGVGATFRFVRPATTLNCVFKINGPWNVVIQNLYWADKAMKVIAVPCWVNISHCIIEALETVTIRDSFGFSLTNATYSAVDGSYISGGTAGYALLFRNVGSSLSISNIDCGSFKGVGCSKAKFSRIWFQSYGFGYGSRIRGVGSYVTGCVSSTYGFLVNSSGYATTKVNPATGVGIVFKGCDLEIDSGDVSDCGSHGLEIQHSRIDFQGALAGTGNGGAGVYAHLGSALVIKNGTPPTITGAAGDLAVSNPAAQESTWAAIDGGAPVAVLAEMTMAKEI